MVMAISYYHLLTCTTMGLVSDGSMYSAVVARQYLHYLVKA